MKAPRRAPATAVTLDDVDIRLLLVLQSGQRLSNADLQRAIRLSDNPVRQRLAKLQNAGIITGHHAVIDIELVNKCLSGLVSVTVVFSEISIRDRSTRPDFEEAIRNIDEVVGCWVLSGTQFDYLAQFVCADMPTYWALTDELEREFDLTIVTRPARNAPPKEPFGGYPLRILTSRQQAASPGLRRRTGQQR